VAQLVRCALQGQIIPPLSGVLHALRVATVELAF
jgi:hypothetical protein